MSSFNEIDADETERVVAEALKEAADNLPHPTGYRILIAIPKMRDTTQGGIAKPEEVLEREQAATIIGLVVSMGPDTYKDANKFPSGAWCKVGDYVIMRSYAGTRFSLRGQEFRLINDDVPEGVVTDPRGITKV